MTRSFFKKKARMFFTAKRAILTANHSNCGGEQIEAGEAVTIMRKSIKLDYHFDVLSDKGVEIHNISCEDLELIKTKINDENQH